MVEEPQKIIRRIEGEIRKVVHGLDDVIEEVLVAYFARGHVLLEGVPGTAKTLLARALAQSLDKDFKRIQFTPDLMPVDIIGTRVFDLASRTFHFEPGPIFTDVLLGDEINRTPPKTQSALLEAMQERRVTTDGNPMPLDEHFFVISTQNPLEFEGTFPLPKSQLDRFMLKIDVSYPDEDAELDVLRQHHGGFRMTAAPLAGVDAVANTEEIDQVVQKALEVAVRDEVMRYIARVIRITRQMPSLTLGASPRAGVDLLNASKALALVRGREYVSPDDVKRIAPSVLRHRLPLQPEAEIEDITVDDMLEEVFSQVEVPRMDHANA
jgi:MoxR-like ATPase